MRILFKVCIFSILVICILLILPALTRLETQNLESETSSSFYDSIDYTRPATSLPLIKVLPLKQIAWIPDWAFKSGFTSLQANSEYLTSVSPVWYYLTAEGNVKKNAVGLSQLLPFAHSKNIKVIPSISSFEANDMAAVLNDPQKLADHIKYLENEVMDNGYDGIDLDYESIFLNDMDSFFTLVKELSTFLHSQNKVLTMAVTSQWTNDTYSQTRRVQNLARLADLVDEFRLMSYDFTGVNAELPNGVSPLDWQEAIIRYAKRYIDPAKIVLGNNLYAYVWPENPAIPTYSSFLEYKHADKRQSIALTLDQLQDRYSKYLVRELDSGNGHEFVFIFHKDNQDWRAYGQNVETTKTRIETLQRYGIAGIAWWRLGDEPDAILRLVGKR